MEYEEEEENEIQMRTAGKTESTLVPNHVIRLDDVTFCQKFISHKHHKFFVRFIFFSSKNSNKVQFFDVEKLKWSPGPNLLKPRFEHSCAVDGTKVVVVGGGLVFYFLRIRLM